MSPTLVVETVPQTPRRRISYLLQTSESNQRKQDHSLQTQLRHEDNRGDYFWDTRSHLLRGCSIFSIDSSSKPTTVRLPPLSDKTQKMFKISKKSPPYPIFLCHDMWTPRYWQAGPGWARLARLVSRDPPRYTCDCSSIPSPDWNQSQLLTISGACGIVINCLCTDWYSKPSWGTGPQVTFGPTPFHKPDLSVFYRPDII